MSVAKPQLRGLLHSQIKLNLTVAIGLAIAAAVFQKFCVNDVTKKVHADFYKSYDIEKQFNEIRSKGLFNSCQ